MNRRTIAQFLTEEPDIEITKRYDSLDGRDLVMLEIDSQYGRMKLWLDPEYNYAMRKFAVIKELGDLYTTEPLGTPPGELPSGVTPYYPQATMERVEFVIDSIELKELNGHFVPVRAEIKDYHWYVNGEHHKISISTVRDFDLQPDFDSLKAFEIDIPDGTPAYLREAPGIEYEWYDGKVIPLVDDRFLVIENEMLHVKSQADLPYTDAGREKDASACCDGHEAEIDQGRDSAGGSRENGGIESSANTGLIIGLSVAVVLGITLAGGLLMTRKANNNA